MVVRSNFLGTAMLRNQNFDQERENVRQVMDSNQE